MEAQLELGGRARERRSANVGRWRCHDSEPASRADDELGETGAAVELASVDGVYGSESRGSGGPRSTQLASARGRRRERPRRERGTRCT